MAITLGQDLWDTMAILIAFNSLHKDFNTTIVSFLKIVDKKINQIQNILQSKKAKNISKQDIEKGISNLAMVFRDKSAKKMQITSISTITIKSLDILGETTSFLIEN